jgi:hypothetical protein
MNKALLMHDYCVSPSPESEEESELARLARFIAYSKIQFETEWEEATTTTNLNSDLFPSTLESEMDDFGNDMQWDLETIDPTTAASLTGEDQYLNMNYGTPESYAFPPSVQSAANADAGEDPEATTITVEDIFKNMDDYGQIQSPQSQFGLPHLENNVDLLFEGAATASSLANMTSAPTPTYFIAPITVTPDLHTPTMVMPTSGVLPSRPQAQALGRRRKEDLVARQAPSSTPEYAPAPDLKPALSRLNLESSARGRKRTLAAAPATATSSSSAVCSPAPTPGAPNRKIKKYELSDQENPSVRNAKAAKANRDKKKQAEAELRNTNEQQAQKITELQAELDSQHILVAELRSQLQTERIKNMSAEGLNAIKSEMKEYLAVILPPLSSTFGQIEVQMAPTLAEGHASFPANTIYQQQPSQTLTTHMDFSNRILTYDYHPRKY